MDFWNELATREWLLWMELLRPTRSSATTNPKTLNLGSSLEIIETLHEISRRRKGMRKSIFHAMEISFIPKRMKHLTENLGTFLMRRFNLFRSDDVFQAFCSSFGENIQTSRRRLCLICPTNDRTEVLLFSVLLQSSPLCQLPSPNFLDPACD